jgi:hypothetical protein
VFDIINKISFNRKINKFLPTVDGRGCLHVQRKLVKYLCVSLVIKVGATGRLKSRDSHDYSILIVPK